MSHNTIFPAPEVFSACTNAYSILLLININQLVQYENNACVFPKQSKGRGLGDLCALFIGFGLHFSEKYFEANHVRNNWKELSSVMNLEAHREEICDLCLVSNDFTLQLALSRVSGDVAATSPYVWWSAAGIHIIGSCPFMLGSQHQGEKV